jgi:glycosyltransferase involved in cell wall biosynthesis
MRLLIAGINYCPEESGNAPYTTGFAEHMAHVGHEVHVLAGVPHYPQWKARIEMRAWRRTELINGVHVHRTRHYVPSKQTALQRALYEGSFLGSAANLIDLPKPDAILAVVPLLSDGIVARVASKRFGVPYGLLFQDLVGQAAAQSGVSGASSITRVVRSIEAWIARGAAATAIVAAGFRPYLESIGANRQSIQRVYNWCHIPPATGDREALRKRLAWPERTTVVLHAGNMGHKQGLSNVLEVAALAQSSEPGLLFALAGDGNQRGQLEARASSMGLSNLRFYPSQEQQDYANMLAAADVLLLSQRPDVVDMSFPSKLTSYAAAGRPIVAAVAVESEIARELDEARCGLVVPAGRPDQLLEAISRLRDDDLLNLRLRRATQDYAQRFSKEDALKNLQLFAENLSRSPKRYTEQGRMAEAA